MKTKTRKLLSITGAAVITFTGGAAAATGNLMAQPPKDPPPKVEPADAGTATPLTKKEAKDAKKADPKKEPAKQ